MTGRRAWPAAGGRLLFVRPPRRSAGGLALPLLMCALGALHTVSYTLTAAWPLALLALAALVRALAAAGPRRAALLGWAFGVGWLCAGVWWLFISMYRYGQLPALLAAAAVLALCAALSLYLALAAALFARWRRGRASVDAPLFAALWLAAELARARLLTGFPWVASGYSQIDGPLGLLAPWIGVYGIGALLALAAALLALPGSSAGPDGRAAFRPRLAGVLVLLAGPWLMGPREFTDSTGRLGVTLVQTNVAQDEKFAAERMPEALGWLGRALTEAPPGLVIAPETAVPLLPNQLQDFAPGWWELLRQHFQAPGRWALVGLPLGSYEAGYTNSVAGLSTAPDYRYDKYHLVPFGEFIPTGFRWFTQALNIPLGDFSRGPVDAPSFVVDGQRVAPNICYEDLFGEELAVRFVDDARAPTLMANLSNIGWFGDTVALPQHLNISRMRTLELQRPMLRATNTGVTAVIDHRGRVTARLPAHRRDLLTTTVEGRRGTTPYAAWVGRLGLWPWVLLILLVCGAAAFSGRAEPDDPAAPG